MANQKTKIHVVTSSYDLAGGDFSGDVTLLEEYKKVYVELITTTVAVGTVEIRLSESTDGTNFAQLSSTTGISGSVIQYEKPSADFAGTTLRVEVIKSVGGVTGTVAIKAIGK